VSDKFAIQEIGVRNPVARALYESTRDHINHFLTENNGMCTEEVVGVLALLQCRVQEQWLRDE
jgi:hypothetical protein